MTVVEPDPTKKRRSKKRANGQGSIYQRKDGRWAGAAYVLTVNGTYKRTPVYGGSADDVERKLTEIKARSNRGLPAEASSWTVASYANYWLDHVARPKLRPTTFARYCSLLKRYIIPSLGKKRLTALSPSDVRLMLARTASTRVTKGPIELDDSLPLVAPRTVQQVHAVLRTMLSHAVREEVLLRNVARLVQAPASNSHEIRPWTEVQARRFLAGTREHRLHALFVLALALGCRQGELLGLRWEDIDFHAGQLRIVQSLQKVRGEEAIFGPPKSRRSRRVVTMPAVVVEALLSHRRAQNEERHRVGDLWGATGLVFTTGTGRALDPRNLSTTYHRLLSHVDVPHIRFHDLRHTCATLLLGRGVSPRVVMDILGHSQIAVTMNIYGHVMPAMQQEAAGQIDAALGGLDLEPIADEAEPA